MITNPKLVKKQDAASLSDFLEDLGLEEARYLRRCKPETLEKIASYFKPLPAEELRELFLLT